MAAIFICLVIASIIIIVLTMTGLGSIGTIIGFLFVLAIFAYIINKLMNIEDKLDMLLSGNDDKNEKTKITADEIKTNKDVDNKSSL